MSDCDYRKVPGGGYPVEVDVNRIFAGDPVSQAGIPTTPNAPEYVVEVVNENDSGMADIIWADEDYTLILSEEDGGFIFLDNVF